MDQVGPTGETKLRVRYAETDNMGVVYHSNFAIWFEVGRVELMRQLGLEYRAMEKEKLPPAAALRSAQVALWKQRRWSSPYFWAAFQIQGDWK